MLVKAGGMRLLFGFKCERQHYQGVHHQAKEFAADDIPGPFAEEIEQGWGGWFVAEEEEIGAEQVIDAQDKNEINIGPEECPAKTLPGRPESVHENGVKHTLQESEVHHKETNIEVVRESLFLRGREQRLDTAAHNHIIGNFEKEERTPPQHDGQHEVHKITDVKRQHQGQVDGALKQEHVNR